MDAFSYLSVLISIVLGLVGFGIRHERTHQWLAPVGFIAFAGYITFLFLRLNGPGDPSRWDRGVRPARGAPGRS